MNQYQFRRGFYWFVSFMGLMLLLFTNEMKFMGLLLFFSCLFLDFNEWKENKIKIGGEGDVKSFSTDKIPVAENKFNR
jgi:hypothetical protein